MTRCLMLRYALLVLIGNVFRFMIQEGGCQRIIHRGKRYDLSLFQLVMRLLKNFLNGKLQFLVNSISPFSRKNLPGGEIKKGKTYYWGILSFLMLLITSCSGHDAPIIPSYRIANFEVIASGFTIPWNIEVIGEEDYLFTERLGSLFRYKDGTVTQISNIPNSKIYRFRGLILGGLMDVSVHPQFDSNSLVYIAYVATDYQLAVARFQLQNHAAQNLEVIFKANAFSIGSRIAWQNDTHFFLTLGIGGTPYPMPGAQDLNDDRGKIHRLMEDGSIPPDNPIFPGLSSPSSIWSYGHRNPQGLYYDVASGTLYANEHGPLGGDELNIIIKGGNYGWPLFSYGLNYDETPVSNMSEQEAAATTILPAKYWGPDFRVAPSGLIKLSDSNFNSWNGSVLMGALRPQDLLRYNLDTDETEIVLTNVGRVRDVAQLPSGNLLILVDAGSPNDADEGRIIKLTPR